MPIELYKKMYFECKLRLSRNCDFENSVVMLLKTNNENGFLITYKSNYTSPGFLPEILIFKVVGDSFSNSIDLQKVKELKQPKSLLVLESSRYHLSFKMANKCDPGYYEIFQSNDEITELNLSSFTPINEINLYNLKTLYPHLDLNEIILKCWSPRVNLALNDQVSFDGIGSLNFDFNELSSIPKEIRFFKRLYSLSVSFNQIVDLDDELFDSNSGLNASLRYLDLDNNRIQSLPPSFFSLKNLEYVDLSNNNLKYLPDDIKCLTKLKHLYISCNQLTYLPPDILKLPALKGFVR